MNSKINQRFFPSVLGATSEAFSDALDRYVSDNPDGMLKPASDLGASGKDASDRGASGKKEKKKGRGGKHIPEDMLVAEDGGWWEVSCSSSL
jgi:hypothetical protein